MSSFSDKMIQDGFSDPQEYLDYLCDRALNGSGGILYDNDEEYYNEEAYFNDEE